jgi:hypothetical protein
VDAGVSEPTGNRGDQLAAMRHVWSKPATKDATEEHRQCRKGLEDDAKDFRKAKTALERAERLAAGPPVPFPAANGTTLVRDGQERCPTCGRTTPERDEGMERLKDLLAPEWAEIEDYLANREPFREWLASSGHHSLQAVGGPAAGTQTVPQSV